MKSRSIYVSVLYILLNFSLIHSHGTIKFTFIDPVNNIIKIKNFQADDAVLDISEFSLSFVNGERIQLDSLDASPDSLKLGANEEVTLTGFEIPLDEAGLSLYKAGTTDGNVTDPDKMSDYLQWGAEGLGHESVADEKGIWSAGDFLPGSGVYTFTGTAGGDAGKEFWEAEVITPISFLLNPETFILKETPSLVIISPPNGFTRQNFNVLTYSADGKLLQQFNTRGVFKMDKSQLRSGVNFLRVISKQITQSTWTLTSE